MTEAEIPDPPWLAKGRHHDRNPSDEFLNHLQANLRSFGMKQYRAHEEFRRKGPYDELQFILRGEGSIRLGRRTLAFKAPALVLLSFSEEARILNRPGLLKFFFHLNLTWDTSDLLYGEKPFVRSLSPRMLPDLGRLTSILVEGNFLGAKAALWEGLSLAKDHLLALQNAKKNELNHYALFFKYVDETEVMNFSVAAIAARYQVTPSHFSARFKAAHGLSAKQFFLDAKIRKAKERLSNDRVTLAALAEELGFHDAFHLSKCFKKMTGMAPRDYRKEAKIFSR